MAVLAGLLLGIIRAWYGKRSFSIPELQAVWLALVAFAPQWVVFYLPLTRRAATVELASAALIISQVLLLLFSLLNRKQRAFCALGLGLVLNLLVIALNGGLMPVSPETLAQMRLDRPVDTLQIGERVGGSKDILLPADQTRFAWLSDRFLLPNWFPYQAAFSLGDVLIVIGAFWLLWSAGGPKQEQVI